jgi:hypothetical protein
MNTLNFEPLIPPALWALLALAGLALIVWYGWKRPGTISRRRWAVVLALTAVSLSSVLLILLNPTWIEPVRPPGGKPVLTFMVDATDSMATPDGHGGLTRYRSAVQGVRVLGEKLGGHFEIRVATFAETVKLVDLASLENGEPAGSITDLASAVLGAIEQDRPQGQVVVLLSDGIHNAGGGSGRVIDAARVAKAMACPVYTHTLGGDAAVKDLAVDLRAPQEIAFIGQKVAVPVMLRQRGLAGAEATLILSADGKPLDRRQVRLTDKETTEVRFEVGQAKPGTYRYEVTVEPLPEEVTRANNTALLVLRVVDRPVRVLLLEGRPYWDGKFLVRSLLADASIELDSVVRVGENRLIRRTLSRTTTGIPNAPVPGQEVWKVLTNVSEVLTETDGLRSYQIIVLGRDTDELLNDEILGGLQNWLSRDGGCLVCYRGQPTSQVNQRMGKMLPIRWAPMAESRFGVRLTDRGRDLRLIPSTGDGPPGESLRQMPTLASSTRPEQPKPLAVVLATGGPGEGEGEPVVTYQPYGSGRVVVIEGAGMWRWAFLPPQQQQLDEVYRSLWHGLLRWLVSSADMLPGQKLALRGEKIRFSPTEPAAVTLLLREEAAKGAIPAVELRGDGIVSVRTVTPVALGEEPGTYRAMFGTLPEGRYQARVAGSAIVDPSAETAFEVRNLSDERLDLKARPDLMARIAEESGGAVLEGDDYSDLARLLGEHWERTRSRQVKRVAAWDRWWVLAGVFGLWVLSWSLRRSSGLI